MHRLLRVGARLVIDVVVVILALPLSAWATPWTTLAVFGDSLSDMGNAFALSGGAFPPSPPYAERFSNGPVAAEYLAGQLGVPLAPSTAGGTNFAVAGATTGLLNYNFEVNFPNGINQIPAFKNTGIAGQIGQFTALNPAFAPATTLFMVWGGPNDLFLAQDTNTDVVAAATQAVNNLAGDVLALAQLGAQHFLVPNMPDLGRTPFAISLGPLAQAQLEQLSAGFNAGLVAAMDQVESLFALDVRVFDTFAFMNQILDDPAAFGFTDTTTPCVFTPAVATGCAGFVFFDGVHPTTAAHARLGAGFASAVPRPAPLALVLGGLGLLAFVKARRAHARRGAA
jgi:phospholipase/lecithinase/hemolysin